MWTAIFVFTGYFFGNMPLVRVRTLYLAILLIDGTDRAYHQDNFALAVLGIIIVSLLPVVLEVLAARRSAER